MIVHAACGGSTNLILHLPAVAHAVKEKIMKVGDWIRINKLTPRLVDVLPNGPKGFPTWRLCRIFWQYHGLGFPSSSPIWCLAYIIWQYHGLEVSESFPHWHLGGLVWRYFGIEVSKVFQAGISEEYPGIVVALSFPTASQPDILGAGSGNIVAARDSQPASPAPAVQAVRLELRSETVHQPARASQSQSRPAGASQ